MSNHHSIIIRTVSIITLLAFMLTQTEPSYALRQVELSERHASAVGEVKAALTPLRQGSGGQAGNLSLAPVRPAEQVKRDRPGFTSGTALRLDPEPSLVALGASEPTKTRAEGENGSVSIFHKKGTQFVYCLASQRGFLYDKYNIVEIKPEPRQTDVPGAFLSADSASAAGAAAKAEGTVPASAPERVEAGSGNGPEESKQLFLNSKEPFETAEELRWMQMSNQRGVIPDIYRVYLNPDKKSFEKAVMVAIGTLASPHCPDAAMKFLQCMDLDNVQKDVKLWFQQNIPLAAPKSPKEETLNAKINPSTTKIVFYCKSADDAAALVKMLIRHPQISKLESPGAFMDTLVVNKLIQVSGGTRESFQARDQDTIGRNRELGVVFKRAGIPLTRGRTSGSRKSIDPETGDIEDSQGTAAELVAVSLPVTVGGAIASPDGTSRENGPGAFLSADSAPASGAAAKGIGPALVSERVEAGSGNGPEEAKGNIVVDSDAPALLVSLLNDPEIAAAFTALRINQVGKNNRQFKGFSDDIEGTLIESGVHVENGIPVTTYRLTVASNNPRHIFHEIVHAIFRNMDRSAREHWRMKCGELETRNRGKLSPELKAEETFCDLVEWEMFDGIDMRVKVSDEAVRFIRAMIAKYPMLGKVHNRLIELFAKTGPSVAEAGDEAAGEAAANAAAENGSIVLSQEFVINMGNYNVDLSHVENAPRFLPQYRDLAIDYLKSAINQGLITDSLDRFFHLSQSDINGVVVIKPVAETELGAIKRVYKMVIPTVLGKKYIAVILCRAFEKYEGQSMSGESKVKELVREFFRKRFVYNILPEEQRWCMPKPGRTYRDRTKPLYCVATEQWMDTEIGIGGINGYAIRSAREGYPLKKAAARSMFMILHAVLKADRIKTKWFFRDFQDDFIIRFADMADGKKFPIAVVTDMNATVNIWGQLELQVLYEILDGNMFFMPSDVVPGYIYEALIEGFGDKQKEDSTWYGDGVEFLKAAATFGLHPDKEQKNLQHFIEKITIPQPGRAVIDVERTTGEIMPLNRICEMVNKANGDKSVLSSASGAGADFNQEFAAVERIIRWSFEPPAKKSDVCYNYTRRIMEGLKESGIKFSIYCLPPKPEFSMHYFVVADIGGNSYVVDAFPDGGLSLTDFDKYSNQKYGKPAAFMPLGKTAPYKEDGRMLTLEEMKKFDLISRKTEINLETLNVFTPSAAPASGAAAGTDILVFTDNVEAAAQAIGEIVPASLSGRVNVTYKVVANSLGELAGLKAESGKYDLVAVYITDTDLSNAVGANLAGMIFTDISYAAEAARFTEELARGV